MSIRSFIIRNLNNAKQQVQLDAAKPINVSTETSDTNLQTREQGDSLRSRKTSNSKSRTASLDITSDEQNIIEEANAACDNPTCQRQESVSDVTIISQTSIPSPESTVVNQGTVDQQTNDTNGPQESSGALLPLVASSFLLPAMGGIAVAALAGKGSSGPTSPAAFVISGKFAAGPVVDGTSVVVDIYRNGILYKSSIPVDATGFYTCTITDGKGGVIVARARDIDGVDSPDYRSETGSEKNLDADLRAAADASDGTSLTLNITPLTELAVRKMSVVNNTIAPGVNIAVINKKMAALWGLGENFDPTQTAPKLTIGKDGEAQEGDAYGQILALLAGLEEVNDGLELSLKNVTNNIGDGASGWTSTNLTAQLIEALAKVTNLSADVIPSSLKALDQVAPTTISATISGHSSSGANKTGILVAGDLIRITLEISEFVHVASSPALPLTIGNKQVNARYISGMGDDNIVFEYQVQVGDQANQIDVATPLPSSFTSLIKDISGNALTQELHGAIGSNNVQIDAVSPPPPQLSLIMDSGDNTVGSTTDGYTNDGTVKVTGLEAGASWQYSTDNGANWRTAQRTTLSLAVDGIKNIIARQIDLAGNISTASTPLNFTLDTQAPGAVTIDVLGNDNTFTIFHQLNGLTLSGTADVDATVKINWGTTNWSLPAIDNGDGKGRWSVFLTAEEVQSRISESNTIKASVTDLAGNKTEAASRTIAVDNAPLITKIFDSTTNSDTDDGYINASERSHGVTVEGYSTPGKDILVFIDERDGYRFSATAHATTGKWSVNFDNYTLPNSDDSTLTLDSPLSSIFKVALLDGSNLIGSKSQVFDIGVSSLWVSEIDGQNFPSFTDLPVINNAVINGGGAQVHGTAEAGASITLFWNDNITPIAPSIVAQTSNGQWSYLLPASTFQGLTYGEHQLHFVVTDIAGNTTQHAQTVMVANQPPPTPSITDFVNDAPANTVNLAAKNTSIITFRGSAPTAHSIAITWAGATPMNQTFNDGLWTATFSTTPADASNTELTINAFDKFNNMSSTTKLIAVDTTILAPTVDPVGSNNTLNYDQVHSNAGILLSGTAEAGAVLTLVWGNYTNNVIVAGTDGRWTLIMSKDAAIANINNDTGPLYVFQTDVASNISAQAQVNVGVDTIKPNAPIIVAMQGTGYDVEGNEVPLDIWNGRYVNQIASNNEITLSGTAEAGSVVTIIWGNTSERSIVLGAGQTNWTTTFAPNEIPVSTNPEGTGTPHLLTVITTDTSGNRSADISRSILVDTTPPTPPAIQTVGTIMTIQGVDYDVVNWNDAKDGVVLRGTGTKGGKIIVQWGDSNPNLVNVDATTGQWSLTVSRANIPGYHRTVDVSSVNDGANDNYPVTVLELDATGNRSNAVTHNVLVDWSTTAVSLEPITTDGYISRAEYLSANGNNANIALMGSADSYTSVRIQWGAMDRTVIADSDGNWSYKLNQSEIPTSSPRTVMTLTATDIYGNVTSTTTQNGIPGSINQSPWIILNTPTITSVQSDISSATANTTSIVFTVTFSDPIWPENVSAGSFTAQNGVVENVQPILGTNNKKFSVTVSPTSGKDIGSQIYLNVADNSLADFAGNPIVTGSLADYLSIPLDNVFPTIITATDTISGTANSSHSAIDVFITLNEKLQGTLTANNFAATLGSVTQVNQIDDTNYIVRIVPHAAISSGNMSLQLLENSGLTDQAGNALIDANINWNQLLDNVSPIVSSVTNNVGNNANKSNTKIDFIVTFDEALSGNVNAQNFTADNGVVTSVTRIDAQQYKVEVALNVGISGSNVSLHLVGTGLFDAAGNSVLSADLSEQSSVFLDNVAPPTPQLTFNGLTTYTNSGGQVRNVDFIANSGGTWGVNDANKVSLAEYMSGFEINGRTEANSLIKLVWQYTLNGNSRVITIEDSSITHNGNDWSYRFDTSQLPQQGSASTSTLSIYATDTVGNTSDVLRQLVTLGYVI